MNMLSEIILTALPVVIIIQVLDYIQIQSKINRLRQLRQRELQTVSSKTVHQYAIRDYNV